MRPQEMKQHLVGIYNLLWQNNLHILCVCFRKWTFIKGHSVLYSVACTVFEKRWHDLDIGSTKENQIIQHVCYLSVLYTTVHTCRLVCRVKALKRCLAFGLNRKCQHSSFFTTPQGLSRNTQHLLVASHKLCNVVLAFFFRHLRVGLCSREGGL